MAWNDHQTAPYKRERSKRKLVSPVFNIIYFSSTRDHRKNNVPCILSQRLPDCLFYRSQLLQQPKLVRFEKPFCRNVGAFKPVIIPRCTCIYEDWLISGPIRSVTAMARWLARISSKTFLGIPRILFASRQKLCWFLYRTNFNLSLQMKGFAESATFRGTNICYSSPPDVLKILWRDTKVPGAAARAASLVKTRQPVWCSLFEQRSLSCLRFVPLLQRVPFIFFLFRLSFLFAPV